MKLFLFPLASLLTLLTACAPKTTVAISTDPGATPSKEATAPVAKMPDDCITFEKAKYPEDAINAHAIYRTYIRKNDLVTAFPYWQEAYASAPAADGKRSFHYTDGVRFYKDFFEKATDEAEKAAHVAKVRELYAEGRRCFPAESYLFGMEAFDLYYSFRDYSSDKEIYDLFKKNIDIEGDATGAFVLNPFTDVLISRFQAGEIGMDEARHYVAKVNSVLAAGLENSEERENFAIVASYAPARLEELETTEGFYPSSYYIERYYPEYEADPTDCDVVQTVFSRLSWGKVDKADPRMVELAAKLDNECKVEEVLSAARVAVEDLRAGRYSAAVKGFEQAAEETDDSAKKAGYYILIAKINYAHLKNFGQARTYAQRAAKYKPNWGEPYILIGKLYASSGPLCGPGRGWDSQVVTWPAIDKWEYARSIDPSVAAEAGKLINQYSAFMPSREDIFQRSLQEGQPFTVSCWIQENTRIRAAK